MKINAVIIIGAAYALGILTSYSFFKNRERERADAEIKSAIEHITNRVNGTKPAEKKEATKETEKSIFTERNSLDSGERSYGRTNYSVSDIPTDRAETESPKEDDDEADEEAKKKPHEITMEEYYALVGVEKKSLRWFSENDVLTVEETDESDITPYMFVDDECTILGDVLVTSKFKESEYIDVIYVYNPVISAAYEVTKTYGKYEF